MVLDASALLVLLKNEPGARAVQCYSSRGAAMSAVNWAEVLTKLSGAGKDPDVVHRQLRERGLNGYALWITGFDEGIALQAAKLRESTRALGLSLGDRACLATALHLRAPAITSDQAWSRLPKAFNVRVVRDVAAR